jgi:hypothetical protein
MRPRRDCLKESHSRRRHWNQDTKAPYFPSVLSGHDQFRHLSLPSEKKGDHAKGVNEPVSQNARPQVTSR